MKYSKLKRTAAIIVCLVMLCSMTVTVLGTGFFNPYSGDVNGDGTITSLDYVVMRSNLIGGGSISKKYTDVTGDGKFNALDYIKLRLMLLGNYQNTIGTTVEKPISMGCQYTLAGCAVSEPYPDIGNIQLTDGYTAYRVTDYFDERLVGINKKGESSGSITIDLCEVKSNISRFEFSFLSCNTAGITPPSYVDVSYSNNGSTWTKADRMSMNNRNSSDTATYMDKAVLVLSQTISARYVKFTFGYSVAWIFVDEVSVYAKYQTSSLYDPKKAIADAQANDITATARKNNLSAASADSSPDFAKAEVSLSQGLTYNITGYTAKHPLMASNNNKLTDGETGKRFCDGNWISVYSDGKTNINLNLGSVVSDISSLTLHAYTNTDAGIYLPTYVDFEVSSDGKTFYNVYRQYAPTEMSNGVYVYDFRPKLCLKAQYVRYKVGPSSGYSLISEVNVGAYRGTADNTQYYYPPVILDTESITGWSGTSNTVSNLALGNNIQIDSYVDSPIVIKSQYNTPASSALLTDGKICESSDSGNSAWFRFHSGAGRYVYIDLKYMSALKYVKIGALHANKSGIYVPNKISVYLSADGEEWFVASTKAITNSTTQKREDITLSFDKSYKARYVCIDLEVYIHVFLDEIGVYGTTSLNGASDLTGLTKFKKPDYYSGYNMNYTAPGESLINGASDVYLAYYTKKDHDEAFFMSGVAYNDNGVIKDTLFDSFLFLPNPHINLGAGGNADNGAYMSEFELHLDKLFKNKYNLDALDSAAGKAKAALGLQDYKYTFFLAIPYPAEQFGDIDGDGKTDVLNSVSKRVEAVKWYVEEFYSRYNPASYPNLEFGGWYWFNEYVNDAKGDTVKGVTDYIHSIGDQIFWIPWNMAPGYEKWQEWGFDVACMQPNHAFDLNHPVSGLEKSVEAIINNNMAIEMEIGGNTKEFFEKYVDYLEYGKLYGYMTDSIHMYYALEMNYQDYANDAYGYSHEFVQSTYLFIKHKYGVGGTVPDRQTVSCKKNGNTSIQIVSEAESFIYSPLITVSAANGTVVVNEDGSVTYYPNRGFTGTDTFKVASSDISGVTDSVTITVTVQ